MTMTTKSTLGCAIKFFLVAIAVITTMALFRHFGEHNRLMKTQFQMAYSKDDIASLKFTNLKTFLNKAPELSLDKPVLNLTLPVDITDFDLESIFIQFINTTEVKCNIQKRIGNVGDGGWNVCEYGTFLPKGRCLVYSFGINNDWSFDDGVVKTYNCTVRSFDPSMSILDQKRGSNIYFLKEGLAGRDVIQNSNLWRYSTLKRIQGLFNEANTVIDYLKIDIEGWEWESLNVSLDDGSLLKVKQIGFEIHIGQTYSSKTIGTQFKYFIDIFRRLRNLGFYMWHTHGNEYVPKFPSYVSKKTVRCCYELVFLNLNYL